jgi:Flp pilus assembly pilin Flp
LPQGFARAQNILKGVLGCFWCGLRSISTKQRLLDQGRGMRDLLRRLREEEEGQDLTEYALLLVLVALSAIATMKKLASSLSNVFSNAAGSLST